MIGRRLSALGLAAMLLTTACAGVTGDDAATNQAVFVAAFDDLATYYVTPPDPRRLSMDAIAGIHVIDPHLSLVLTPDGGTLVAFNDDTPVVKFFLPGTPVKGGSAETPADSPAAWARLTATVAAWCHSTSPAIRDYGWEGLRTTMLEAATADLDPYTHYFAPPRAQAVQSRRDGYAGIGLTVASPAPGRFVITEVADGGPAARAGVRVDDEVAGIDGVDTGGLDLADLTTRLRGPAGAAPGSTVALVLRRGDANLRLTIARQKMFQPTVSADRQGGIGVLRISHFNAGTAAAVAAAIRRLQDGDADLTGWVLDLRGNSGGLLDQSIAVADMLLDRGVILSTRGRHPDSHQHYEAGESGILLPPGVHQGDMLHGLPLMVLVDGRTASSAEVLAGALADNGRGILVGATTFGKGVVQTLARLPDGGEMSITWSHILTPSGRAFDHRGLHPAICTAGETRLDNVLARLRTGTGEKSGTAGGTDDCPVTDAAAPLTGDVAVALLADRPLRTLVQTRLAPAAPARSPQPALDQPQTAADGDGEEP